MLTWIQNRRQESGSRNEQNERKNEQDEHGLATHRLLTNHPARGVNHKRSHFQWFSSGELLATGSIVADRRLQRKRKAASGPTNQLLIGKATGYIRTRWHHLQRRSDLPKSAAKAAKSSAKPNFRDKAVRSRAFARAILHAKPYTLSGERLSQLLQEAGRTMARLPKQPFADCRADLFAMLRLLKAFQLGDYKIPQNALLSIVAAVAYLVDPNDFIPDDMPFLGFLDDATIVEFAAQKTRGELDAFMSWELRKIDALNQKQRRIFEKMPELFQVIRAERAVDHSVIATHANRHAMTDHDLIGFIDHRAVWRSRRSRE